MIPRTEGQDRLLTADELTGMQEWADRWAGQHSDVHRLLRDAHASRRLLVQAMDALVQLERPVPCSYPDTLSDTDYEPCSGHCHFCDVADDRSHPHVHDLDCQWLLTYNALRAAGITASEPASEEAQ